MAWWFRVGVYRYIIETMSSPQHRPIASVLSFQHPGLHLVLQAHYISNTTNYNYTKESNLSYLKSLTSLYPIEITLPRSHFQNTDTFRIFSAPGTTTATVRTASPASTARPTGTNAGPVPARTEPPASTRSPTSTAPARLDSAVSL